MLAYLQRTSGYSRAKIKRLVSRSRRSRLAAVPLAKRYRTPAAPFARKFTAADMALLVEIDHANEDVCGPAVAHLLQRGYNVQGDIRYERLTNLSVSHLYNLRKSTGYKAQRRQFIKTPPGVCNPIGVRRVLKDDWAIRIDSVHQGDLDGIKGVYHITYVDGVSQWQVEVYVEGISEAYLLPMRASIIDQFPLAVEGFHSNSGSEYINTKVVKLLNRIHFEQTKSRSRQSNDNAQAEAQSNPAA